jgi:SAM-dependent methyltransferase
VVVAATSPYDLIGDGYAELRRPDHRIAGAILAALGPARTVVNVGAGAGSYEPTDRTVVAVEPAATMIAQRPAGSAPVVRAPAEALPFPDDSFDASLAVLTVHHWHRLARGLAELCRVSVRRRVVLHCDPQVMWSEFWLVRDYLSTLVPRDHSREIPLRHVAELTGAEVVVPVPVPHDCTDGFFGAYWRRPAAYLDERVRSGISAFALAEVEDYRDGLARLEHDLRSGAWHRRYGHLLDQDTLDLGYRLVVAIDD